MDPVPVEILGCVSVKAGVTYETPMMIIPGIASGAAYAVGDALGLQFQATLPAGYQSGLITKVVIMDRDKEALALDLEFFSDLVAVVADNAAYTISDADHLKHLGTISIGGGDFVSYNAEASATKLLSFPFATTTGALVVQAVARGVQNLTAATDYGVRLSFLLDP